MSRLLKIFWWPLLLLAGAALTLRESTCRNIDDGDPSVVLHFGSRWDALLVLLFVIALSVEAHRAALALRRWRDERKWRRP